jgi:hypothetical protein
MTRKKIYDYSSHIPFPEANIKNGLIKLMADNHCLIDNY